MEQTTNKSPSYPETPESSMGRRLSPATLLGIIRRRWLVSTAFALLFAGAFAAYYMTREPIYKSSASLVVEINEDQVTNMTEVVDTGLERGMLETIMNTHRERLQNRDLSQQVVSELSSSERKELASTKEETTFGNSLSPAEYLQKEVIHVEWIPDTQVLEVTANHSDPYLAEKIARLYTELYIEGLLGNKDVSNDRAVNFLDNQAVALRDKISRSEEELQNYRAENHLVSIENDRDVISQKLNQISEELTDEHVRVIGLESTMAEIQKAGNDMDDIIAIDAIGSYEPIPELVVDLKNNRNEYKVLNETYLSEHPQIKKNKAKEASLLSAIETNINQAIQRVQRQLDTAKRRESQLKTAMAKAETEAQELDRLAINHNVLERRLETQKKTYDQLVQRLNETSISSQLQNTNIRVLEKADLPTQPISPAPARIAIASSLIFAFVLIGLPLLWESVDTRLRTFAEIESFVGKPVLGHLQNIRRVKNKPASQQIEQTEVLESFRSIFAQITLEDETLPLSLLVTSTSPGEGKSFVSANLAETCARHGLKTILIDADLRRSSLQKAFEVDNKLGLNTWFHSESGNVMQLGITKVAPSLDFLPSGGNTKEPTELIRSNRFKDLLRNLKSRYDVVILDTPPIGPCPDALLVARNVKHTIFVARQNANSRHKIRSAVRKLDRSSAPVLGLILNRIVGRSADASYANYRSEYGVNYGYSSSYYAPDLKSNSPTSKNNGAKQNKRLNESLVSSS